MFVLTNVRPFKSVKNASAEQKLESNQMSKIRRAYSELSLKLGSQPSLEQLAEILNEPTENLQNVFVPKPATQAVNNEILESQYLNQRVAQILSQLSDRECEAITTYLGLDCQNSRNQNRSKIAYLAEHRLRKMLNQEEFGNFLA